MSDNDPPPAVAMDDDDYESALAALSSSVHQSSTKEAIRQAATRRTRTLSDMQTYMKRISLLNDDKNDTDDGSDWDSLVSVVHVAGTKGKGSVCAMCETILRSAYGATTGLFTSPHLVDVRERIRVNGKAVSKRVFGQAYWTVRQRLEKCAANCTTSTFEGDDDGLPILPGYFRMLTLLAFFIFRHYEEEGATLQTKKKISYIILEVGMGGRYDATNAMPWPKTIRTVCGVTLIDFDHVRILGNTLPEIAWEKGGIYQVDKRQQHSSSSSSSVSNKATPHPGREKEAFAAALAAYNRNKTRSHEDGDDDDATKDRCFALDSNDESVLEVLRLCAATEGQGCSLHLVGTNHNHSALVLPAEFDQLALQGSHQRANAELAIALCRAATTTARNLRQWPERMPKQAQPQLHEDVEPSTLPQQVESTPTTSTATTVYTATICQALTQVTWPGRCQTVVLPITETRKIPTTLRLDGAHTVQSVRAGLEWYRSVTSTNTATTTASATTTTAVDDVCRVLLFNCSHERNPVELLEVLLQQPQQHPRTTPLSFHGVYFCRADSERPSAVAKASAFDLLASAGKSSSSAKQFEVLSSINETPCPDDDNNWTETTTQTTTTTWQDTLLAIWKHLELESSGDATATETDSNLTVTTALERAVNLGASKHGTTRIEVFVLGSLYLVGSMLSAIQWQEPEAIGKLHI